MAILKIVKWGAIIIAILFGLQYLNGCATNVSTDDLEAQTKRLTEEFDSLKNITKDIQIGVNFNSEELKTLNGKQTDLLFSVDSLKAGQKEIYNAVTEEGSPSLYEALFGN